MRNGRQSCRINRSSGGSGDEKKEEAEFEEEELLAVVFVLGFRDDDCDRDTKTKRMKVDSLDQLRWWGNDDDAEHWWESIRAVGRKGDRVGGGNKEERNGNLKFGTSDG